MSNSEGFSTHEKNYLWFFVALLVFAFFYQLGTYPLFLEEPRRGLISLEMLYQNNLWVPTQTGDLYFRKPPFYNWVLILSYKVFGVNEFATRFFSVLSHLALGWLTFFFSKKYLGNKVAVLAALSYLLSADILLYFSALGEIDLFYALITGASIFFIYHFGEQKRFYSLFLIVYLLTTVGFLTKGLSSLPFTAISLLVYFIMKKDFKRLFSIQHFSGILLLVLLLFGYFYQYNQYQDVGGWWNTLYSESADKATGGGFADWLNHLISFPLDTLKNMLPATFFLPFLWSGTIRRQMKENQFVWFCVLIFLLNFLLYWFSSEGRSRYIYPIFPFGSIVLVFLYSKAITNWKERYLKVLGLILTSTVLILFFVVPFIESLAAVEGRWFITIISVIFLVGLIILSSRNSVRPYLIIFGLFVVIRLGFSFVIPQTREKTTGAAADKALGKEIALITQGESLYRMGDVRMSLTIAFYIEKDRGEVLYQMNKFEEGYFFSYREDLPETNFELIKEFDYHGEPIFLIHFNP